MVVISVLIGFSEALGAFMAGSILAGTVSGEKIHRLIKPIKDLFGAVFFVSVGMMVEPPLLVKYIVPILIPGSYFLSKLFSFFSEKHSQGSKPFGWSLLLLFVMSFWAISSMLFYLNIIA